MAKQEIVNKGTGEIITVRSSALTSRKPPKKAEVTNVSQVAGANPSFSNLRDHPEYSGMDYIIADVSFRESTIGGHKNSYVIMSGWLVAPGQDPTEENYLVIATGSENVQGRIATAIMAAEENGGDPFPLRGTFRNAGRAWFLD